MKHFNRVVLYAVLSLCLFVAAAVVTAGVPAKTKELTISYLDGKKKDPFFSHEKHTTEYVNQNGKKAVCKDCHHTLKKNEPKDPKSVKPCSKCHVKPGQAKVKFEGEESRYLAEKNTKGNWDIKKNVFHEQCRGCHQKLSKADSKFKKLPKCTTCHKK